MHCSRLRLASGLGPGVETPPVGHHPPSRRRAVLPAQGHAPRHTLAGLTLLGKPLVRRTLQVHTLVGRTLALLTHPHLGHILFFPGLVTNDIFLLGTLAPQTNPARIGDEARGLEGILDASGIFSKRRLRIA